MKKKLISLLLVGAMAASMFAGCGSGSDSSNAGGSTSDAGSAEGGAAEDGYSTEIDMTEEPYEVGIQVVVLPGTDYSEIEPKMEEALNAISVPAVNAKVDVQFVSIAELNQTTQLAVASGGEDKIDIVAVSTVMTVDSIAGKDLLADMNEKNLLQNRGSKLVEVFGDAVKVGNINGQQLTVPANTYYALETGLYYNKTLADKYGITLPEKGTMADLETALYALKDADPSVMGHFTGSGELLYYNFFYGGSIFGSNAKYGAILDSSSTTIKNLYATEEFKSYCETMLKWHQDGIIQQSDNSDSTSSQDYIGAGKLFYTPASLNPVQRANYVGNGAANGIDIGFMVINDAEITSSSIVEYMWGIASSCERPDKAMDVLNLLYSNEEFANILKYGFEGENYAKTGENTIQMFYNYFPMFYNGGDTAKMYNTIGEDFVDQMEALESSATKASTFGYIFLDADFQTESAVLEDTIVKYLPKLQAGLFADEAEMLAWLDEFNGALEAAGINDVIAGNQAQLDAFLAQ